MVALKEEARREKHDAWADSERDASARRRSAGEFRTAELLMSNEVVFITARIIVAPSQRLAHAEPIPSEKAREPVA